MNILKSIREYWSGDKCGGILPEVSKYPPMPPCKAPAPEAVIAEPTRMLIEAMKRVEEWESAVYTGYVTKEIITHIPTGFKVTQFKDYTRNNWSKSYAGFSWANAEEKHLLEEACEKLVEALDRIREERWRDTIKAVLAVKEAAHAQERQRIIKWLQGEQQ